MTVYYEDKVIDGVLHWRDALDEEWKPMSPEMLTEIVIKLQRVVALNIQREMFYKIQWPPQSVVTENDR